MHNISNLFYFGTTIYMFRTVFPSILRSLRLYKQHHTIQVLWLLASKLPVWCDAVCTVLDSGRWTERPSETCRMLFQNKIYLKYYASGWFYYRNKLRCTVLQTQNLFNLFNYGSFVVTLMNRCFYIARSACSHSERSISLNKVHS